MNVKRFLGLSLFTYLMCAAFAVTNQKDTPLRTMSSVPATITLGDLTPQQLADRATELTTTTSTTSTSSTIPYTRLASFDPDTKCQEWFQTAITVGWPNNTETLEKLGRLLWKETRCLNVSYTHPSFNGHDHGVAQINEVHRNYVEQLFRGTMEETMADPTLNLRFAYLLYSDIEETGGCGWRPWRLC